MIFLLRRSKNFEEWRYSKNPDPEFSERWSDITWPPGEWYYMPDSAVGKLYSLWRFDEPKTSKKLARKVTREQLLIWAVNNVVGQVNNGGFSSVFYNSYGQLAEEAVVGLRLIGLRRHAEILDEAYTLFGVRPVPRNREARIEILNKLAALETEDVETLDTVNHPSTVFQRTHERFSSLQKEFYALNAPQIHSDGRNDGFFRPVSEWIYENRDRFFVV